MPNITICPVCGTDFRKKVNYSTQILLLMERYRGDTKKIIKEVCGLIMKNDPFDNNARAQYYFLKSVENISERAILMGIDAYIASGAVYQAKGFSYLKAIIRRNGKNNEKILENEIKMRGNNPPKYKHKSTKGNK